MRKKLRGLFRLIFGRTTMVIVSLFVQFIVLFGTLMWFSEYTAVVYTCFTILGVAVLVYILNENINASFKLAWIIPVLVIPIFGTLLYIFCNIQVGTRVIEKRMEDLWVDILPLMHKDADVNKINDKEEIGFVKYMDNFSGYPPYNNTLTQYYPLGDDMWPEFIRQLKSAKKFIFMEYFIVDYGYMWSTILEILKEKAKDGVEVRFMYDGMCCLALLPYKYPEELQNYGIRCKMFAPIKPILSTHQNNRDHRKICVIDGHTAFTGGINLADEYINKKVRFGHWKDTAIMVRGEAVENFTLMFLQLWNVSEDVNDQYEKYIEYDDKDALATVKPMCGDGYVLPYTDSPFDGENIGKQVYLDILNRAKNYVHIMTPYLILDDETKYALIYAAKRGVDTCIIMPHIPDKRYAFLLAKSYYRDLIAGGVKIYEYTPGFVHAKVFVADDERSVVGTINLDFRSLYLHFECGVYTYKNKVALDIEKDYQDTLLQCHQVTLEELKKQGIRDKVVGQVFRLFAPLM